VVDKFPKLVKFGPTKAKNTTMEIIKLFIYMWLHTMACRRLVSDHDAKFTLKFLAFLMKKVGIKLKFNMICYSQINRKIERGTGILNQYFSNYVNAKS
jgi:hypothetical protein